MCLDEKLRTLFLILEFNGLESLSVPNILGFERN